MKTKLSILALVFALAAGSHAAPIAFEEVSLLVRMRETDGYILQQVSQRRLLRGLTPEQEAKLKAEGGSAALLEAMRNPAAILPAGEAAAFEKWSDEQKRVIAQKADEEAMRVARATAEDALRREREERAARDREVAKAVAQALTENPARTMIGDDYGAPYYYGGGGYVPSHGYRLPGGHGGHAAHGGNKGVSGGALQWQNGTTTSYSGAGLFYHPLGTNGATANAAPNAAGAQCVPGPAAAGRLGR